MRDISHVLLVEYAHTLRTGSFCFFFCCQINSKTHSLFSVYQSSSMNTSRIFFQIWRPGLYATALYLVVIRVRTITYIIVVYLSTYGTRLWSTLQQVHRWPHSCRYRRLIDLLQKGEYWYPFMFFRFYRTNMFYAQNCHTTYRYISSPFQLVPTNRL